MAKRISGVYTIRCRMTGDFYIGGTQDINDRWRQHRNALRKGKHFAKQMQADWNLYGEDTFEFSILEEIPGIFERWGTGGCMTYRHIYRSEQGYIWTMRPTYNRH